VKSLFYLPYDFMFIKLDNSAANDRLAIEFSSIVCIALNTKKLLINTTNANILASWVGFFYKDPLPSVSKRITVIFLFSTYMGYPHIHIPYVQLFVDGDILNYKKYYNNN
jgi:hypothetical protein